MLKDKLHEDMKKALKSGDKERLGAIRYILGELNRQQTKDITDDQIINIIKKIINSETEVLKAKGEETSLFLETLNQYVPDQVSDEDIKNWIINNVDLSQYKNKMQAMKPIMEHFGQTADGKKVRDILTQM